MATSDSSLCSEHQATEIMVVGGGVAGLATAVALHRIGLKSLVLERSDRLRASGSAFVMWDNAWKALEALGVADTLRAKYCLIDGLQGFSNCSGVQKDVQLINDHKDMNCLESRCIERSVLLETLAKVLPKGSIRFNSKLVSIHKETGSPFTNLQLENGTCITAKIVIGCDGVHSVVAQWIGLEAAKPTGRVAIRGMATFPQGHHRIDKKFVQIVGKGVRAGFVPCTDKQVYWFITRKSQPHGNFLNMISTSLSIQYILCGCSAFIYVLIRTITNSTDAKVSRDPETLRCAALQAVKDFPEPIGELIKSSSADTLSIADLKLRWVWPWEWDRKAKGRGSVTVVGDALHPMTPDLGQGACSAMEDAVVLARCLSVLSSNFENKWGVEEERMVEECFREYRAARKWKVFGVTGGSFLAGMVMDGYSSFLRFLREWLWLPVMSMSYLRYFAATDCGSLLPPIDRNPSHKL